MKLRTLLTVGTLAALPLAAQAQPITGTYVGAGVGINQLLDSNISGVPGQTSLRSDIGLGAVGSVGYGFGGGLRGEIEGNFRAQHSHITPFGSSGMSSSYGPMANLLYDFDLGASFYPYVGAGVGAQWMHVHGGGTSNAQVAAQGILGVAYPLGTPGLSLTGEARVLVDLGDQKFNGARLDTPTNISGLIGLRYAFGVTTVAASAATAAATPAPAAPAGDARTYLVFFDWDKSDLTARARQIIADAAGASSRLAVTRIEVAGHADTSGTPPYNQGLSMRRAQTVGAELVRLGVKKEAITIEAFGDTRPLVATGTGVREPQNRRVEINIR
jgi:outer membrane protein OmpA-like peptidoglycan-associated protein